MAQKVIRTYSNNSDIKDLQKELDRGYKVIFITPMQDYIEYILQG